MDHAETAPGQGGGSDALLGLLLPFWQVTIGLFVVFALVMAGTRLARRGPSRMNAALLYLAAAIATVVLLAVVSAPH